MHRGHAAQPSSVHADGLVLPLPIRAIDWRGRQSPAEAPAKVQDVSKMSKEERREMRAALAAMSSDEDG